MEDESKELAEQEADFLFFDENETKFDSLVKLHADNLATFKDGKKKVAKIKADLDDMAIKVPALNGQFEFDLVEYNACTYSALAKLKSFLEDQKKDVIDTNFPYIYCIIRLRKNVKQSQNHLKI